MGAPTAMSGDRRGTAVVFVPVWPARRNSLPLQQLKSPNQSIRQCCEPTLRMPGLMPSYSPTPSCSEGEHFFAIGQAQRLHQRHGHVIRITWPSVAPFIDNVGPEKVF